MAAHIGGALLEVVCIRGDVVDQPIAHQGFSEALGMAAEGTGQRRRGDRDQDARLHEAA